MWARSALAFALLAATIGVCAAAPSKREVAATIVVYNSRDPASERIARYYAEKRGLGEHQIIALDCPQTEEITRDEYDSTIAAPLREIFTQNGWWRLKRAPSGLREAFATRVRFVALVRGIPLKIKAAENHPGDVVTQAPPVGTRNEAAVDSEVAALCYYTPKISGMLGNPYFRRFTPVLDVPELPSLLLVTRLDGPTEEVVKGMIDGALAAERDGLWGWAYIDGRSIKDPHYVMGDDWLRAAATSLVRAGMPVCADFSPETLPEGYPLDDAAIYYGWYAAGVNGPFVTPGFRFRPGAIAVHIHSFSAATLREPTTSWCAPLLAAGAAATLGNVYEPYLALGTNLDIFTDRLLAGFTFAESAYIATRSVSWMNTFVGDPLFRPFAARQPGQADAASGMGGTAWGRYSEAVVAAGDDPLKSTEALRRLASETGDALYLEGLANAEQQAGQNGVALQTFAEAMDLSKDRDQRLRITISRCRLLLSIGRKRDAFTVAEKAYPEFSSPASQRILRRILAEATPPTSS